MFMDGFVMPGFVFPVQVTRNVKRAMYVVQAHVPIQTQELAVVPVECRAFLAAVECVLQPTIALKAKGV